MKLRQIVLALDTLGRAKGDDLAGRMSRPFEARAIVCHAKIVHLALLNQAHRGQHTTGRDRVERADLIVLAPWKSDISTPRLPRVVLGGFICPWE